MGLLLRMDMRQILCAGCIRHQLCSTTAGDIKHEEDSRAQTSTAKLDPAPETETQQSTGGVCTKLAPYDLFGQALPRGDNAKFDEIS